MAELGELLGALMSSLAHARRIADEETAAIAELYKQHPLLEGMSMPRVRVPEMRLNLPILIEAFAEGGVTQFESPANIRGRLLDRLDRSAEEEKVQMPAGFKETFAKHLDKQLATLASGSRAHPEAVVRANEIAFTGALRGTGDASWLGPAERKAILLDLRKEAESVALAKRGPAPRIEATITTSEIKERAAAQNVPRLDIVLREEGVEWSVSESADGTKTRSITPE